MATRLPIVINNGQLQQLQAGDVLSGPTINDGLLAQTFNLAVAGTTAANSADMWGRDAFSLAVSGTNAAAAAYSLAAHADALGAAGTSAAAAAYSEAVLAYNLAVAGTNAAADNTSVSLVNDDVVAHLNGTIVYIDADDGAKQAKADSMTTAIAVAFATGSVAPAQLGSYRLVGLLKNQAGLTPGSAYYLSPSTAGQMTVAAPVTQGQVVVRVGSAISSTMFKVNIEPPILL